MNANSDARDARPQVDRQALRAWLVRKGLGDGQLQLSGPLSGGTQNIMLEITCGDTRWVARFPPMGSGARGVKMIQREITVLGALARTDVPHPRLITAELDPEVVGSPFYLMERVAGHNVTLGWPLAADDSYRHGVGLALAEAVADLGMVNPGAVGLDGFGRPEGFLERQVGRWLGQLESYSQYEGYPGHGFPNLGEVVTWLEANQPAPQPVGLFHGDVHLGNVLFREAEPRVAALVDWELATLGDPLLDLAGLLVTWPGRDGRSLLGRPASVDTGEALASEDEIVARYRAQSTRDVTALRWYIVLACFRLASILEGTKARACAGLAPQEAGANLHRAAVLLMQRAYESVRAD